MSTSPDTSTTLTLAPALAPGRSAACPAFQCSTQQQVSTVATLVVDRCLCACWAKQRHPLREGVPCAAAVDSRPRRAGGKRGTATFRSGSAVCTVRAEMAVTSRGATAPTHRMRLAGADGYPARSRGSAYWTRQPVFGRRPGAGRARSRFRAPRCAAARFPGPSPRRAGSGAISETYPPRQAAASEPASARTSGYCAVSPSRRAVS